MDGQTYHVMITLVPVEGGGEHPSPQPPRWPSRPDRPGRPDQGLPGQPPRPDQGLPGQPYPDQSLPPGGGHAGQLPSGGGGSGWVWVFVPGHGWGWFHLGGGGHPDHAVRLRQFASDRRQVRRGRHRGVHQHGDRTQPQFRLEPGLRRRRQRLPTQHRPPRPDLSRRGPTLGRGEPERPGMDGRRSARDGVRR